MKKTFCFLLVLSMLFVSTSCFNIGSDVEVNSISLNKESVVLNDVWESCILEATILPTNAKDKSVKWSSADDSVATVDKDGIVIAKGFGTTTVQALSSNGKSATCTISVEKLSVQSLSLDKTSVTLKNKGDKVKLTATIMPAKMYNSPTTWSSSDVSVATVNGVGEVVAKGYGKTVITVSSENGKSAECVVTVGENGTLYKSYAGIYYLYSFDNGEEIYFSGDMFEGFALKSTFVVLELYADGRARLIMANTIVGEDMSWLINANKEMSLLSDMNGSSNIYFTIIKEFLDIQLKSGSEIINFRLIKQHSL